jgi:putative ABC transport system permease protein
MNSLRHALRVFTTSPGYAAVTVAILALGIGATTAIFSVVHAVLLKPLAYADAARLVQISTKSRTGGTSVLAPGTFADLARQTKAFSAVAAHQYYYVNLTKTQSPARLTEMRGSRDYFKLFGVAPLLGRTWSPEEARVGAAPVVVLSAATWRSQFNADPNIVAKTILLDDVAHTVLGVMPDGFDDPWGAVGLWRPYLDGADEFQDRKSRYVGVYGRLADGVSLDTARAELATFNAQLQQSFPDIYAEWSFELDELQETIVSNYRTGLFVVLGAVGCVLLITCANVAGLAVARAASRRKEFAIRTAIGASSRALLRDGLLESVTLALVGGGLGLLLANWGIAAIMGVIGESWLPRANEIELSRPVLLAALGLSLATGVVFGLFPAWGAARTDANEALKTGSGRSSDGPATRRLRSILVVAEVALALVLLVGAGLLARSFGKILRQDTGMRTTQLVSIGLSLSTTRYDTTDKRRDYYARLEQAVSSVPGVVAAGFTQTLPFTWGIPGDLVPDGPSEINEKNPPSPFYDSVSVDFFRATGIPLVAGRLFTAQDDHRAPPVVLLSATTAKLYFGDANPLGRQLRSRDPAVKTRFEIVGVVGDVPRTGLGQKQTPLQIYRPILQRPTGFATLLVQTSLRPDAIAQPVRQAIWRVDSDQAIGDVSLVTQLVRNSTVQPRLYLALFGLFAALALLLSGIGLYGLIAYGVTQRTREFGIRLALGAAPRDVLHLVLREGALLAVVGLALGLAGAFASARFLQELVYQVSVYDPAVFGTVFTLLALVAVAASFLPARRATKVDPMIALRAE